MSSSVRTEEHGFTLIELLVVVVIIGILTAIAVPAYLSQRNGAFRASVQADLRNAAGQMEVAYRARSDYPTGAEITFRTGPEVTLVVEEPSAGGGQVFCITARHARLDGGAVVLSWDSDGGGSVPGNVC